MKTKRFVTTLLFLFFLAVFVLSAASCGRPSSGVSDGTGTLPADSRSAATDAVTEPAASDPLYADLPTGYYDGHEVNILQYHAHGAQFSMDMDAEEDDGTLVNGTLWKRTVLVEDRLGIDISLTLVEKTDEVGQKIDADIAAEECNFEIFSNHSAHLAVQTMNGQAIAYSDLPGIDLTKPWWNDSVIELTKAGDGRVYMGFGYINMSCFDSQCGVWFNKDLAEEYQLGDIYAMVKNKEWTMDRYIQICRTFAANGENLYGVSAYPYVGAPGLVLGCGVSFFEKDSLTGRFTYLGVTDKMYDVNSKMGEMLRDKSVSNLDWATYFDCFRDGESFSLCVNVSGMKYFRGVELNYGLAPFPMYNEEQKTYLSYTTNQLQGVCVAVTTRDAARSAVIIENLAAESYRRLRDVYFEQLLNERLLRDEESKEILADIFETPLVLPIEAVYDFKMAGNIFGFDGGDGNITSRADACREAVNKALDDFYAWG